MKPPSKNPSDNAGKAPRSPAKKPNLAAKALSDPKFRLKVVDNPDAYRRKPKFTRKLVDLDEDDEIN